MLHLLPCSTHNNFLDNFLPHFVGFIRNITKKHKIPFYVTGYKFFYPGYNLANITELECGIEFYTQMSFNNVEVLKSFGFKENNTISNLRNPFLGDGLVLTHDVEGQPLIVVYLVMDIRDVRLKHQLAMEYVQNSEFDMSSIDSRFYFWHVANTFLNPDSVDLYKLAGVANSDKLNPKEYGGKKATKKSSAVNQNGVVKK